MTTGTATLPLSVRLRQKLALFASGLEADLNRLWTAEDLPRRYPLLLRELHALSRGGGAQMPRIARHAGTLPDEAARKMAAYMARHTEEERGHWNWLLDDLEALGCDRATEAARPPSMWTASILGCGYVWALDQHPACYLGFLSIFEGNPYPVAFFEDVIRRSGLPKESWSFMLDHAKVDVVHSADIHRLMDSLELDAATEQGMILCALQVQSLSHELLRAVLDAPLS